MEGGVKMTGLAVKMKVAVTDFKKQYLFDFYGTAFLPITQPPGRMGDILGWLSDDLVYDILCTKVASTVKLAKTYLDITPSLIYQEYENNIAAVKLEPLKYFDRLGVKGITNLEFLQNIKQYKKQAEDYLNNLIDSFRPEISSYLKELQRVLEELEDLPEHSPVSDQVLEFLSNPPKVTFPELVRLFREFKWEPLFGGELWAQIAEATIRLEDYYKKVVPTDDPIESIGPIVERYVRDPKDLNNLAVALDLYNSLEHNTGSLFKDVTPEMPYWLTLVASGTYQPEILSKMSPKVRQIVSAYYREVGPPESRKQFIDSFVTQVLRRRLPKGKLPGPAILLHIDESLAGDVYERLKYEIQKSDPVKDSEKLQDYMVLLEDLVSSSAWQDYEEKQLKQLQPTPDGIKHFMQEMGVFYTFKHALPSYLLESVNREVIAKFFQGVTEPEIFQATCKAMPLDFLATYFDTAQGDRFDTATQILFERAIAEGEISYLLNNLYAETAPILLNLLTTPKGGLLILKLETTDELDSLVDTIVEKYKSGLIPEQTAMQLLQILGKFPDSEPSLEPAEPPLEPTEPSLESAEMVEQPSEQEERNEQIV